MQYRTYGKNGFKVSLFGMGCMRLPRIVLPGTTEAQVDKEKAIEMIQYAADHGVNYFDTAFGYHNGTSESVLGEALEGGGRREAVKVVTKQPFGVMKTQDDIRRNLENTLKKLRTDHIDVYLIHNIQKSAWEEIKKRKIIEEYEKFRSEGLIRGIGYSYHGQLPTFKEVLSYYSWDMCQIQQNLLDVDHEATEEAIKLAGEKGCGLVIMEPLRGGNLAIPPAPVQAIYEEYPVKRSAVEWAFRHVINYPQVSTILSGVTTLEQLKNNIEIFSKPESTPNCLTPEEKEILTRVKVKYESLAAIPCTGCEYCLPCPQGVKIPDVFARYNEGTMFGSFYGAKRGYFFLTKGKADASFCVACKECEAKCPQHLEIPKQLETAHAALSGWIE
ncbi:oxidoreductase, aldo/keto reductase family [Treponema primitia ZAS-2]|uniref:Oxidoreductase, aldo/keto reductase family n=1 Tax=Treponema primitia (strain ATCC BAA-887 / DSM 12427 / ZAS-2) TaxID=545694 RepID=F5YK52_TREPZ|nr:aldo/keto reductase [Treponema primitia]AEF85152.1 oxidoreductase, aldo/keto reductase family [Treponema primitia ZAS-2]